MQMTTAFYFAKPHKSATDFKLKTANAPKEFSGLNAWDR
jgi:hypothetical protein